MRTLMWTLAWKNVWRGRGRSLVTAGAVAAVVAMMLVMYGFSGATLNGMFQNLTRTTGHLVLRVKNADEVREFDLGLVRGVPELKSAIVQALPEADVEAVLEVPALLAGASRSRGVVLMGLEPDGHLMKELVDKYRVRGAPPTDGAEWTAALGLALARALQVDVGDPVYAFAPGTDGLGAAAFTVSAVLDLPESTMEARTAVLTLRAAQELAAPDAASRIVVFLPGLKSLEQSGVLEAARRRLQPLVPPGYEVLTWREAQPALAAILDMIKPMMLIYAVLFFVLAGLLVVNTVYLGLVERIREFGVIIALGADRWRIMRLVVLESLLLVTSGAVFGGVLGGLAVWRLAQGFSLPGNLAQQYAEFGLPVVMYASITPGQVVQVFAFAVLTAIASALWPAWLAGRLEPVEAMRHVA
ncbi:ABC transporter permease [Oceanithermus desulfurans]|nr:FtsX-like permease family protein [Oceanithermus desulfurans]MBB6029076.1 ABC-type lipoprotein release transport system permease subunit [Oceanithermus desulfurans]